MLLVKSLVIVDVFPHFLCDSVQAASPSCDCWGSSVIVDVSGCVKVNAGDPIVSIESVQFV